MKRNRGFFLILLMGVVLVAAFWIGSLSVAMSNSRSRFHRSIRERKAWYLARSGLQHFFLKMKLAQQQVPEGIELLINADESGFSRLSAAFIEDIVLPYLPGDHYGGGYRITEFSQTEVVSEGSYEGSTQAIRRVIRIGH